MLLTEEQIGLFRQAIESGYIEVYKERARKFHAKKREQNAINK